MKGRGILKKAKTVCISLYPDCIKILDKLASGIGTRSGAIAYILRDWERKRKAFMQEKLYKEYFKKPENKKRERKLTKAMSKVSKF